MPNRNYQQSTRASSTARTRAAIVGAALARLADPTERGAWSMQAVAQAAGVSRMTVFNCFEDQAGLLHAVCDHMALAGGLSDATPLLNAGTPGQALRAYVDAFAGFYECNGLALRRLRGFAAFDEALAAVVRERDGRRTSGLAYLVCRLHGAPWCESGKGWPQSTAAGRELMSALRALLLLEVFELTAGTCHKTPAGTLKPAARAIARSMRVLIEAATPPAQASSQLSTRARSDGGLRAK